MSLANPTRRSLPPLALGLLAVSAAVCVYWFLRARGYWEDDAYIHLEFARSLARGRGFAFNGAVVYGDTSPLWVWLLAGFHAVIPDWIAAGKTLTAVACMLALAGAYVLSRELVRAWPPERAQVFAATMVLVTVTAPYFGYWAFSGMEALAGAGLACWAVWSVTPEKLATRRFLLAALLAGIAPLLRPEMIFLTLLVGLLLLWRLVQDARQRLPRLCGGLVLLAAPTVAWAVYAVRTFGSVLPNTDAAKRAGPADSVVSRLEHVYVFGYPATVLAALLLAGWCVWAVTRRREALRAGLGAVPASAWLFVVWTVLACGFYIGNHTYVQTRYIVVTAPGLTLALLAIAAVHWPRVYAPLLTAALVFGCVVSVLTTRPLVRNKVEIDRIYAEFAAYLRTLPPDAPVAHYSIGEAAFLSEHPIIDTGGITRPGIIPYLWDGDDRRQLAWMYLQGAQYDVVDHSPAPGAVLLWSREIPEAGWSFRPSQYRSMEKLQLWKLPRR